jgi:membrane-associated protease RseP (regulator of RpoE activity)
VSIFISIVGLGLLILIHEAGHFFVARAVGMNPRKFYIGFPPALAKRTWNGIEYGIGAIPLGGYVKMAGMHRPTAGDVDQHFGAAVAEAPELAGPLDRLRRGLTDYDLDAARAALEEIAGRRDSLTRRTSASSDASKTSTETRRPDERSSRSRSGNSLRKRPSRMSMTSAARSMCGRLWSSGRTSRAKVGRSMSGRLSTQK